VIAAFLPASTYAVVCAYGGREAIILAQRLQSDLILLDLIELDHVRFIAEARRALLPY
jgi:CheY-like chemotaxis protein